MTQDYQICTRCVMDTSDPEIKFDDEGICSHCHSYKDIAERYLFTGEDGKRQLDSVVARIREEGKGKEYDCLIGLSGGIDSTLVAYEVKRLGLRALAVHLDNGWNSELAVSNVEKIVKTLDIDLYTEVLDWDQFRDLQLSFLKAGVANCEIPTDHAIISILYRLAYEKDIRYVIGGNNIVTEGILPKAWGYNSKDWRHVKAVQKRFGSQSLAGYPHISLFHLIWYTFVRRVTFFPILNCLDYDKTAAKKLMAQEIGWKDYGGKHYESIFTRFFQAHILPQKFGFDKRRAHLATLVNSGQMTRDEAMTELAKPTCDPDMLAEDRTFVLKKLGLNEKQFETIMQDMPHSADDYPNNRFWFENLSNVGRLARKLFTGM